MIHDSPFYLLCGIRSGIIENLLLTGRIMDGSDDEGAQHCNNNIHNAQGVVVSSHHGISFFLNMPGILFLSWIYLYGLDTLSAKSLSLNDGSLLCKIVM